MRLSGLFALLMLVANPAATLPLQDTAASGGDAQAPAPTVPAPSDAAKQENSADATKAPDEAKKAPDTTKAGEVITGGAKKTAAAARRGKHRRHGKRVAATTPDDGELRRVVIHHGGALEPTAQIVPGMPPEEAMRLRLNAEELLAAAGGNLRTLGARVLEPQQQETMTQIRDYMEKAQSALKDGDVRRAHTLALKAQLLADDLVKH